MNKLSKLIVALAIVATISGAPAECKTKKQVFHSVCKWATYIPAVGIGAVAGHFVGLVTGPIVGALAAENGWATYWYLVESNDAMEAKKAALPTSAVVTIEAPKAVTK